MRPKSLLPVFSLLVLASVAGCSPDSPLGVLLSPPDCTIADIQKSDALWPQPAKIAVTVKNRSDATAYDVECDIKLKSGNTIVDEGAVSFGTLEGGESMTGEAWFWKISTHGDYANAAYHLFWYDSQGTYHD